MLACVSPSRTEPPPGFLAREWHGRLGRWFRANKRDLPWRRTRDPYAIWISEAMLQQTRVEVVIPYFARFLARFPDVQALAAATEEDVLALWSGLGYYSRARALRAAAQVIVERHGGVLPRMRAAWLALPGVGPYTAGAVLSIAFSAREPLVDGNVQRVLARLLAWKDPQGSPALARRAWEHALALLPRNGSALDPGDWNQALMELGARVCTPRAPRCEECPLAADCFARARGLAAELPRPRSRHAPVAVRLEIALIVDAARVLVVRRPVGGRMAGMFELPTRELVPAAARARLWPADGAWASGAPLGEIGHTITHHRIRATVVAAAEPGAPLAEARWVPMAELDVLALIGLARKALALDGVRRHLAAAGRKP